MPDRSVATSTVQIGVEALAAPGVAVAANKRLGALGIELASEAEVSFFGPNGELYDTVQSLTREWASGSLTGTPTYTEMVYPLSSVLGNPAIVTPGGATLSRDWDFPVPINAMGNPRRLTVENGDVSQGLAERIVGAVVPDLNLGFSRTGGNDLGGSLMGERVIYGARLSGNEVQTVTITGAPTAGNFTLTYSGQTTAAIVYNATAAAVQSALEALSNLEPGDVFVTGGPGPATPYLVEFAGLLAQVNVAQMTAAHTFTGGTTPAIAVTTTTPGAAPTSTGLIPILPSQINVYVDDTAAALGTTQLTRDFSANWSMGGRWGPVWALNRSKPSYDGIVALKPDPTFSLSVGNDAVGQAFIDYMRDGRSKFVRIEGVGPEIETGYNYRLRIDLCGKISGPPGRGDADGVATLDYDFRIVTDATWGKAMALTLRNNIASL